MAVTKVADSRNALLEDGVSRSEPGLVLGTKQILLLKLVRDNPGNAFATSLVEVVNSQGGVSMTNGQVFTCLRRLELRSLLESSEVTVNTAKGLRTRRLYQLSAAGARALEAVS